jgi:hypothetical protein
MNFEYKNVNGFEFVKVGNFYINNQPLEITYKGKKDKVSISLGLINEQFKNADESAYLICSEDELVYVGEFSYNLEDRWLRKKVYVWHHKDELIEQEILKNKNVSLWLIVNPFVQISDNTSINISKSIEQEILKKKKPLWNKRGEFIKWEKWKKDNCVLVTEIIKNIKNGLTT